LKLATLSVADIAFCYLLCHFILSASTLR